MANCRILIENDPQPGSWNMAVDEVLLESALARGMCTLRWYRWPEATLSLGYFQNLDDVDSRPEWKSLPAVRRLTGGGAIVHHHEWTYSCAIPSAHELAHRPSELFARMHGRIIDVLHNHGIAARLRGESDSAEQIPFLCFQRGDANDVVLQGHKIVGSAQRRRRGAVLQHGSLLLRTSPYASHIPGMLDFVPPQHSRQQLLNELTMETSRLLGNKLFETTLAEGEFGRADELERGRYRHLNRHQQNPTVST
jgi:lipoate-protein ligase A